MKKPDLVYVPLAELIVLLNYFKAAIRSEKVGNTGLVNYDELIESINRTSKVGMTVDQLENLIHHYKLCVMNKVVPGKEKTYKNYHWLMQKLKLAIPSVFRVSDNGEIVLNEFI